MSSRSNHYPGFTVENWLWILGCLAFGLGGVAFKLQYDLDVMSQELASCSQQLEQGPVVYKTCDHIAPGPVPGSFRSECDSKCAPQASAVQYDKAYGWKCLCDPDVGC